VTRIAVPNAAAARTAVVGCERGSALPKPWCRDVDDTD
jgi:hypothetical protein